MRCQIRRWAAALLLVVPLVAWAHTGASAYLDISRDGSTTWKVTWDVDLRDLQVALDLDADRDGALTWREVQSGGERIAAHLASMAGIAAQSRACDRSVTSLPGLAEHGDADLLRVVTKYSCEPGALGVDATPAMNADPSLRILLAFDDGSTNSQAVVLSAQWAHWRQGAPRFQTYFRFLIEGMRHLLTGYDHLAFLAVLLLGLVLMPRVGASPLLWRAALQIVTAFTVAHSVTLALAVTGLARLPAALVEVAIAASIVVAAVLNLLPRARRYGWQLALGFGLVHGFGFAGALAAMAPHTDLYALAAFNLGIELAQLACAAVVLPLLIRVMQHPGPQRGLAGHRVASAASVSVALLAAWWLVQRLAVVG